MSIIKCESNCVGLDFKYFDGKKAAGKKIKKININMKVQPFISVTFSVMWPPF